MSPRNSQFSKDDLVDAAFALVREHGWQGFSVQTVAKAIGSSTMPIYSHFGNLRELEDAVVWKAFELLKERLLAVWTGDKWIDHAISWVRFAEEERHLHNVLWDGRNPEINIKCGEEMNNFITEELADYELFAGLSKMEVGMITLARRLFIQRLASWLNRDPEFLKKRGMDTEEFIRRTSKALYDGFRLQFAADLEPGK